jgi:hypothetical protein
MMKEFGRVPYDEFDEFGWQGAPEVEATDVLDRIEDVTMGALERIHDRFASEGPSERQITIANMRNQRRAWQIQDDIIATKGTVPADILAQPLVPQRKHLLGRVWYYLNRSA